MALIGFLSMRAYRDGESYTMSTVTAIANTRLQLTRLTTSRSHSSAVWPIHLLIMNDQSRVLRSWLLAIQFLADGKRARFIYPRLLIT